MRRADTKALWLLEGATAHEVAVRTGSSDGQITQIIKGPVAQGDLVITDQSDEKHGGAADPADWHQPHLRAGRHRCARA